jgi:hypothetical protein
MNLSLKEKCDAAVDPDHGLLLKVQLVFGYIPMLRASSRSEQTSPGKPLALEESDS